MFHTVARNTKPITCKTGVCSDTYTVSKLIGFSAKSLVFLIKTR